MSDLLFASTSALERALDGGDESFRRYFFALYQTSPDEDSGINDRRKQLRAKYPDKSTEVGRYFVLYGEAAAQMLSSFYQALSLAETLSDDFRAYAALRRGAIEERHASSQSLPIPIDLSEGQLSEDKTLDFYACVALLNRQIVSKGELR